VGEILGSVQAPHSVLPGVKTDINRAAGGPASSTLSHSHSQASKRKGGVATPEEVAEAIQASAGGLEAKRAKRANNQGASDDEPLSGPYPVSHFIFESLVRDHVCIRSVEWFEFLSWYASHPA